VIRWTTVRRWLLAGLAGGSVAFAGSLAGDVVAIVARTDPATGGARDLVGYAAVVIAVTGLCAGTWVVVRRLHLAGWKGWAEAAAVVFGSDVLLLYGFIALTVLMVLE
jgi:hypothetical protein